MTMKYDQLVEFRNNLQKLAEDMPHVMDQLVVGEGVYAAKQAKLICKNDEPDIINTGNYRNNWHSGDKATRTKREYKIDVFNNADYASHIEYGFRSHWVPGEWQGNTFVYIPGVKTGMYVGPRNGYVKGRYVLRRAIKNTKKTQDARLQRKLRRIVSSYAKGGSPGDSDD